MINGKFFAIDDFDVAGHHILNWIWLQDIPVGDSTEGQVIANVSGVATWATLTSSGIVSVDWDDITNKPAVFPPEDHTHPWDEVTGKPTFVNSITAGIGIEISAQTGTVQITNEAVSATGEPNGFPNLTDSSMTVTNNRTFSITPTGASFDIFVKGNKFTISSTESVTFPDTEGLHYVYYDDAGVLASTTVAPASLFSEVAFAQILRWDATNNTLIYVGEERHGIVMDGKTHEYLHDTEGTRFVSGHALGDITADGGGAVDSDATLSVGSGTIADEDLFLQAAATTNATQVWETYFKTDTGDWRRENTGNFPLRATANTTVTYNLFSGGTWSQSNLSNNQLVLAHIFRTNSTTVPYICVQGESGYANIPAARAGAVIEIGDLFLSGLPFVEFSPLGTVIYQYSSAYGNSINAQIRSTDLGDDYVDWRDEQITPSGGPSDHGSLSGLSDPDHPLTALQQSSAATNQAAVWSGATWTAQPVVNDVTAGTNITVSATNGTGISIATVTNPTFAGDVTVQGDLYVSEFVYHDGDTDTFMQFSTNSVAFKAGGADKIIMAGDINFYDNCIQRVGSLNLRNQAATNVELRFQTSNATITWRVYAPASDPEILRIASRSIGGTYEFDHMVFDADTARVGILTDTPAYTLDVTGTINATTYRQGGDLLSTTHLDDTANLKLSSIQFVIHDSATLTTGTYGPLLIPFDGDLTEGWLLAGVATGSVSVDVWSVTYGSHAATNGDSISGGSELEISSDIKSKNTTLTAWTKPVSAGDLLYFNIDSCVTLTDLTIVLLATKDLS